MLVCWSFCINRSWSLTCSGKPPAILYTPSRSMQPRNRSRPQPILTVRKMNWPQWLGLQKFHESIGIQVDHLWYQESFNNNSKTFLQVSLLITHTEKNIYARYTTFRRKIIYYVTTGKKQRFRRSTRADITRVEIVTSLSCHVYNFL